MKKFKLLIIAALISLGVTSCKNEEKAETNEMNENSNATSETAENNAYYPITIDTYNFAGEPTEMTFEKAPERVLAVYQSPIETMLAMGLGGKLIATAGLDYPIKAEFEEEFKKTNYLEEFTPGKETVVTLEPDLIFSWHSIFDEKKLGDVNKWSENGVNTYMSLNSVMPVKTMENEYTDLMNMGKIFNEEAKAKEIVTQMQSKIDETVKKTSESGIEKSVLVMEMWDNQIRTYGKDSLPGDMLTQLGAKVISPETEYISNEALVSLNPDVIFVVHYESSEGIVPPQEAVNVITENPMFASLTAVKNKDVYPISSVEIYCTGVRTADAVETLAKGVYPTLF